MDAAREATLRKLAARIHALEGRAEAACCAGPASGDESPSPRRPTGWSEIDAALEGGLAGGLHEWLGVEESEPAARWSPPVCILVHLARQALRNRLGPGWAVWVGRACHPYPRVLVHGKEEDTSLLDHSLFVAPRDAAARLWAIDLALRCAAVGVVIADGSGLDRAATQRIALLAAAQDKWALVARPPPQRKELSAAQTRWRVQAEASKEAASKRGAGPRWRVELLRCKGKRSVERGRAWLLEWNRVECAVDLSAPLANLAGAPRERAAAGGPLRKRSA